MYWAVILNADVDVESRIYNLFEHVLDIKLVVILKLSLNPLLSKNSLISCLVEAERPGRVVKTANPSVPSAKQIIWTR